jgi:hypothetical protein
MEDELLSGSGFLGFLEQLVMGLLSMSSRLLQRLGIGFVLWRLFVQQGDQFAGGGRGFYLAAADDVFGTELLPIKLFVGAAIGA